MKFKFILLAMLLSALQVFSQTIKECNIYPTNLEENMYFDSFDAKTNTLKGVYFMVLSDGENSEYITPEFTVKLYLFQNGKDPIFIKTFEEKGIYHFGKKEYNNLDIQINTEGIDPGTYRVGIYVNADNSFKENKDDNAILFKQSITIASQ
jgi:hypothetical protein